MGTGFPFKGLGFMLQARGSAALGLMRLGIREEMPNRLHGASLGVFKRLPVRAFLQIRHLRDAPI